MSRSSHQREIHHEEEEDEDDEEYDYSYDEEDEDEDDEDDDEDSPLSDEGRDMEAVTVVSDTTKELDEETSRKLFKVESDRIAARRQSVLSGDAYLKYLQDKYADIPPAKSKHKEAYNSDGSSGEEASRRPSSASSHRRAHTPLPPRPTLQSSSKMSRLDPPQDDMHKSTIKESHSRDGDRGHKGTPGDRAPSRVSSTPDREVSGSKSSSSSSRSDESGRKASAAKNSQSTEYKHRSK